jgi:hypothetical protein
MAGNGNGKTIKPKERKLIKAIIDGKSVNEASKISGYNPTYTPVVLRKPEVKEIFAAYLDKAGLSDTVLSEKIRDLVHAKEKRFFAHAGIVMDEREVPALEIQRRSVELACKLKGHMVERVENELGPELLSRLFMVPYKPPLDQWTPPDDETT